MTFPSSCFQYMLMNANVEPTVCSCSGNSFLLRLDSTKTQLFDDDFKKSKKYAERDMLSANFRQFIQSIYVLMLTIGMCLDKHSVIISFIVDAGVSVK